MAHRPLAKLFAPAIEEWLTADHKPACSQLDQACKERIKVTLGAGMQDMELQSEGVRRRLQFFRCGLGTSGIGRIDERGNHGHRGDQLMQQLQPLLTREFKLEAVRLIRDRGVSVAQASVDL